MFQFTFSRFEQLSLDQLYAILKLRQDVFMLEQNSLYQDIDDLDQQAWHLCAWSDGEQQVKTLAGYVRIRLIDRDTGSDSDTNSGQVAKVERVVLPAASRGTGLGRQLFQQALREVEQHWPQVSQFKLSAQTNATGFYRAFGFQASGQPYDDGGIEHIDMVRT